MDDTPDTLGTARALLALVDQMTDEEGWADVLGGVEKVTAVSTAGAAFALLAIAEHLAATPAPEPFRIPDLRDRIVVPDGMEIRDGFAVSSDLPADIRFAAPPAPPIGPRPRRELVPCGEPGCTFASEWPAALSSHRRVKHGVGVAADQERRRRELLEADPPPPSPATRAVTVTVDDDDVQTPPRARPPRAGVHRSAVAADRILMCHEIGCDYTCPATELVDLITHTLREHHRRPTADERTPTATA